MTDLELLIMNAAFEDELEKIAMLGTLFGVAKKAPAAIPKPSTKFISGLGNVSRGAQTQVRTAGTATGKAWKAR
ncbi:MAG: hypothetical protein GWN58_44455, partial [Anaerolineae bacterium]|nr:hypothetical protein [Anaerolineae bacterium]